jgi:hypothetical protein
MNTTTTDSIYMLQVNSHLSSNGLFVWGVDSGGQVLFTRDEESAFQCNTLKAAGAMEIEVRRAFPGIVLTILERINDCEHDGDWDHHYDDESMLGDYYTCSQCGDLTQVG